LSLQLFVQFSASVNALRKQYAGAAA